MRLLCALIAAVLTVGFAAPSFAATDLSLGALPSSLPAPDHPGTGVQLTLEQCVAEALARNFTVRISGYSVDQAKAGVIIAQSVYDPVLGVQWQKTVEKSSNEEAEPVVSGNSVVAILATNPYDSSDATTVSATQNLPTGGQVSAGYTLGRDYSNPPNYFLNPAYNGGVSLSVSQPLLQGAGLAYSRAAIDLARLGERVANLNLKSTVLTMIYNVETAYFDVAAARRQYEVAKDNVALSQQLLDENRQKRAAGVLTDLDVVQAEAGVATTQSQLIGYRQAMQDAEDTLLQAMGERQFQLAVGAMTIPAAPDTDVSFDWSYKLARDNGPSLAIAQATIDQYKLQALRAKRQALPQLGVTGGAGLGTTQTSYSYAFDRVWNGPGYNWQAGVTLSFPWGLRQTRAEYRQARDNLRSGEAAYDQADQTLVVQLRAAVRAVDANREGVASAAEATRLSAKQYELQKARFDAGLATSYDVLQAQYQLEAARVSQLQAEVSLRIAVADLHFLEGTTLDAYHIKL